MIDLLGLAVVFLIIALVAYAVGARGIAGFSMEIAKILRGLRSALPPGPNLRDRPHMTLMTASASSGTSGRENHA